MRNYTIRKGYIFTLYLNPKQQAQITYREIVRLEHGKIKRTGILLN